MWSCPNCQRTFKNPNQAHSCVLVSEEELLLKSNDQVREIYKKLSRAVKKFGDVQVNSSNSTINFKNGATFLVLKPKKERMDLEFLLNNEVNEFPINKTFRVSKNRIAHFVSLESVKDLDEQLFQWLNKAYHCVKP